MCLVCYFEVDDNFVISRVQGAKEQLFTNERKENQIHILKSFQTPWLLECGGFVWVSVSLTCTSFHPSTHFLHPS